MTRYENFMAIAHAYYNAYVVHANELGKKPLSYDVWLRTDKDQAPGFDGPADERKPEDKSCGQCRDTQGRFCKTPIEELAKQVEKERGPAKDIKIDKTQSNANPVGSDAKYIVFKEDGTKLEGKEAEDFFRKHGIFPFNSDDDDDDDDNEDNESEDEEKPNNVTETFSGKKFNDSDEVLRFLSTIFGISL